MAQVYGGWSDTVRDRRVHYYSIAEGFRANLTPSGHHANDIVCAACREAAIIRRCRDAEPGEREADGQRSWLSDLFSI